MFWIHPNFLALPANTQILGISPSGESYWARTAKIDAWDAGGKHVTYFLKVRVFKFLRTILTLGGASRRVGEKNGFGRIHIHGGIVQGHA